MADVKIEFSCSIDEKYLDAVLDYINLLSIQDDEGWTDVAIMNKHDLTPPEFLKVQNFFEKFKYSVAAELKKKRK